MRVNVFGHMLMLMNLIWEAIISESTISFISDLISKPA